MKEYIHYIRRNVGHHGGIKKAVGDALPFYASIKRNTIESIYYPLCHVTRAKHGPAARIQPGDVIWVVTQLYSSWGSLPPGLDMKIIVRSIEQEISGNNTLLRFNAEKGSKWFSYKNIEAVLRELQTLNKSNVEIPLWKNPDQPIGYYLQSIRQLKDGTPLQEWASRTELEPFDFISYRIKDGTFKAWSQVSELIKNGTAVFWDRWTLPRSMVERRELMPDEILTDFLQHKIKNCRQVIPVPTDLYGAEGSYSAVEKEFAIGLGKFKS